MANSVLIDIFCPNWSKGLSVSAKVLQTAIERVSGGRLRCRIFWTWETFYAAEKRDDPPPSELAEFGRAAILVERVFSRPFLESYRSRILLPNPEWLAPSQADLAETVCEVILHKSRSSLAGLAKRFPRARHHLIGFSSPDPMKTVDGYGSFSHFRGKATTRFTQSLLDIWQRRPDLPPLSVQAYGRDISVRLSDWLTTGNINLLLNYHETDTRYFADLARGGIHLCTSSVEAFGHYLNESRAMSALVLTLDAPPMNELVTPESGVLIGTTGAVPMNLGVRFETTDAMIEQAVDRALGLSIDERKALGRAARRAYEAGHAMFDERLRQFVEDELNPLR